MMDQKFELGGVIACGDSYLEFLFRHFKVFRLQHDAAGGSIMETVAATGTLLD